MSELMSVPPLVSVLSLVSVAVASVVSIAVVESSALLELPPHPAATRSTAATDTAMTKVRTIRLSSERA